MIGAEEDFAVLDKARAVILLWAEIAYIKKEFEHFLEAWTS